jgi:DNA-binding response OmpR family regulator
MKERLLLVDDDKAILRAFKKIFENRGYEVDVADTGKQAIKMAGETCYVAALLDVVLPDMDGTDLLSKLNQKIPDSVKIILTGSPTLENGTKSLDNGADAYMVKPVDPAQLVYVLGQKIASKKLQCK